ncbi:MAG: MFS transporter, partial [Oxalobacteraceae bacterium]
VTYFVFFALGVALYASVPTLGHSGSIALFVAAFCIVLSMYGGGFATVPAYLADLFGTQMVGAIHGRLLTAWAVAGVLGPVLVTNLRDYQLAQGVPRAAVYDTTLYILSGLLVLGFICNALVRPVADKYFMTDAELKAEQALGHDKGADGTTVLEWKANPASKPLAIAAWLAVGIPLAWGVWVTLQKTAVLFH